MEQLDLTALKRKIFIKASINELYKMFATQKGLETWFLASAVNTASNGNARKADDFAQTGDEYAWQWNNYDGVEKGKVVFANGTNEIHFGFAGGLVKVILTEHPKGAVLVDLSQTIPQDDERKRLELFYGCGCGWTFWLTNLKAYLEHGILLHLKENPYIERYPNYGYDYVTI